MKKIALTALGLTGLLASCGISPVVVTDPARNLQLLAFESQYRLPTAYTDTGTGTVYPAGTSIICDNANTRLQATLDWDGDARRIGIQLEGSVEDPITVFTPISSNGYSANPSTVEVTFGPGVAPLSVKAAGLKAQAIVVTPVNTFTVKGITFLNAVAESRNGQLSNVVSSVQGIPVADCNF